MKTLLPIFLLFFLASNAVAQLVSFPLKGKFFISVDDKATLYLNGTKVCTVGFGETPSPEIIVEPNDRIVVHLLNTGGPKRFAMIFVSTDGKTIISFRNQMCKIIPDSSKMDFTKKEYEDLKQFADQTHRGEAVKRFGYKNNSEWIWGVGSPCALGSLLMRDYFKALTP